MSTGYPLARPQALLRWHLPYGRWTTKSGREVLYDRAYRPCVERLPDGTVRRGDPEEWVREIVSDALYLYDDGTPEKEKMRKALGALDEWGVREEIVGYWTEQLRAKPRRRA